MNDIIIIMPALNPPYDICLDYLIELKKKGFERILLINDGCDIEYKDFFDKVRSMDIDVFEHYKNLGKGRALKNAFNYILTKYEDYIYAICVDSDGQHQVSDVLNIANTIKKENDIALYLGSRNFDEDFVPYKSKFGNKITSFVYKLFFSDKIKDTQTGLRAIPKRYLEDFIDLDGERFEYEINMLIEASTSNKKIKEIPINTVYFDNNKKTHFNPITDSFKIYKVMVRKFLRFILSSISSWIVDISSYTILLHIFKKMIISSSRIIWLSTFIARIISGVFNFFINKNLVFKSKNNSNELFFKYFILWLFQLMLSAFLVDNIYSILNFNSSIIKIFVDSIIFILSYKIQNNYIF